jgi:hypothetical protein
MERCVSFVIGLHDQGFWKPFNHQLNDFQRRLFLTSQEKRSPTVVVDHTKSIRTHFDEPSNDIQCPVVLARNMQCIVTVGRICHCAHLRTLCINSLGRLQHLVVVDRFLETLEEFSFVIIVAVLSQQS